MLDSLGNRYASLYLPTENRHTKSVNFTRKNFHRLIPFFGPIPGYLFEILNRQNPRQQARDNWNATLSAIDAVCKLRTYTELDDILGISQFGQTSEEDSISHRLGIEEGGRVYSTYKRPLSPLISKLLAVEVLKLDSRSKQDLATTIRSIPEVIGFYGKIFRRNVSSISAKALINLSNVGGWLKVVRNGFVAPRRVIGTHLHLTHLISTPLNSNFPSAKSTGRASAIRPAFRMTERIILQS